MDEGDNSAKTQAWQDKKHSWPHWNGISGPGSDDGDGTTFIDRVEFRNVPCSVQDVSMYAGRLGSDQTLQYWSRDPEEPVWHG
jgi:hypothetical protein